MRKEHDMKTLLIIDGNSLMCRAYFAMRTPLHSASGIPTGGAYGFFRMLTALISDFVPDTIICAFDGGTPEYRKEASGGAYKSNRTAAEPDLKIQFLIAEDILDRAGIPWFRIDGWEGDDIIGTISQIAKDSGEYETYILSSDHDMFQLVDESTFVVMPRKGVSDTIIYDIDKVIAQTGIAPGQITDYKGIKGDSSDNIKGVKGIGDKGAITLLQKYGHLEQLSEHINDIDGAIGRRLAEGIDDAFKCRDIATIRRHIKMQDDERWRAQGRKIRAATDADVLTSYYFPAFDEESLHAVLTEYGFSRKVIDDFIKAANSFSEETIYSSDENISQESDHDTDQTIERFLEFEESLF